MYSNPKSMLLLCTIWFLALVDCYKIDKSCEKAGIANEVEEGVRLAFVLARAGRDALERGAAMKQKNQHTGGKPNPKYYKLDLDIPRPPELENLIRNVFAHDDIINNQVPPKDVKDKELQYFTNLRNLKLFQVHRFLERILMIMENPTDTPSNSDSIIYCDGSRFKPTGSKIFIKDTEREGIKVGGRLESLKKCSEGGLTSAGTFAIAVTFNAMGKISWLQKENNHYPSAIQLCKGTIENIKKGVFDENGNFDSDSWLGKRERKKFSKSSYGFKQVDKFNLLAVTLLHEMTHTRATFPTGTNDVWVPANGLRFFKARTFPAYRWDRIKTLAKMKPYVDREDKKGPDFNADSIAYFALGCYLMSRQQNPMVIENDGTVRPIAAPVVFPTPWPK